MDRDKFIELQAAALDAAFSLTSGEEVLRARFEAMALETYEHFTRAQMFVWPFRINTPGFLVKDEKVKALVPRTLLQQWLDWADEYPRLLDRNPRFALHEMLNLIGESHNASSWPYGREVSIQRWIDKGERLPTPFDDRYSIVTPEFYERLRGARRKSDGMLYWDDDKHQVCFADDTEWQRVVAEQDKQQQENERIQAEVQELVAQWKRLPEVLAAARDDTVFWETLKAWELARETKRPTSTTANTTRAEAISGPIQMAAYGSAEQIKRYNLSVDPIFTEFIARNRQPDDALTVIAIVLYLRSEVRRELGLDQVIGWPGGPEVDVS